MEFLKSSSSPRSFSLDKKHLSFAADQQFCDKIQEIHKLNKIYTNDYQISYVNVDLRLISMAFLESIRRGLFPVRTSLPRNLSSGHGGLAERSEERRLY